MNGLAEYIPTAPCPYPAIVQEWDQIPLSQVQSFTYPGFENRDCFTGMGAISLVSPEGYFQGPISDWGVAEWGTVTAGMYLIGSLWGDVKSKGPRAKRAASSAARTTGKVAKGAAIGLGTAVLVGGAAIALYLWANSSVQQ